MKTTIDKAGRVVIPASIRRQARLAAGMTLEVVLEGSTLRLERAAPGPRLEKRGARTVAVPTVPAAELPELDVPAMIEAERERWP